MDFSEAPALIDPAQRGKIPGVGTATVTAGRTLRTLYGFDKNAAELALKRLDAAPPHRLKEILDGMPADWLPAAAKDDLLNWWDSPARPALTARFAPEWPMARSCDFVIVKFVPDAIREESLNAAIVVLGTDGLDVRVTPNPERLRVIAPHVAPQALDELKKSLISLDDVTLPITERIERFRRLPGVSISEPGTIQVDSRADLDRNIDSLVGRLLTTVRAPLSRPFRF